MIFQFKLKKGVLPDSISLPFHVLFTTESQEGAEIVVDIPFVESIEPFDFTIDWEKQWEEHGQNFKDGFVHLPTTPPIRLTPGPGFGDLSHPTTRLMLTLMEPMVAGETVVDIGTGSGVLALAAARMGATFVLGIDIDPDALTHAHHNCHFNALLKICRFALPGEPINETVALMNMITSEQKVAWNNPSSVHTLITSGVRIEEKSSYISWIESLGFKLQRLKEDQGWLGFIFTLA